MGLAEVDLQKKCVELMKKKNQENLEVGTMPNFPVNASANFESKKCIRKNKLNLQCEISTLEQVVKQNFASCAQKHV